MSNDHALLAPSAASIWMRCAGYGTLAAAFPRLDTDNDAAIYGTEKHRIAAGILRSYQQQDATLQTSTDDDIMVYVHDVLHVCQQTGGLAALRIEQYLPPLPGSPHNSGTPDAWLFIDDTYYIWDLKTGFADVSAFENWQLINYYALLPSRDNVRVVFRIVQRGYISEWVTDSESLRNYVNQLNYAIGAQFLPHSQTTPGEHCFYCPARVHCKSSRRLGGVLTDFANAITIEQMDPNDAGNELTTIEKAIKLLEGRRNGLVAQVEHALRSGVRIDEWEMQQHYGHRDWTVPATDMIAFGDMLGADLRTPANVITPAQAEKKGLDKKIVEQYTVKPNIGVKLVPVSIDKLREAFKQ